MSETNAVEILLVEDSPDDLALTLRALRKANLANHIQIARDGAVEQIFQSQLQPRRSAPARLVSVHQNGGLQTRQPVGCAGARADNRGLTTHLTTHLSAHPPVHSPVHRIAVNCGRRGLRR